MAITVLAGGQPLTLLPEKAAFIEASRTLLVADAHIGKAVSFRALGVPVPRGTTAETLSALSALAGRTAARRIVFLGDFLHSARAHAAATIAAVTAWRERHTALDLVLVRGNHDDRAGDPPSHLRMHVVDEAWELDGFALCHHPRRRPGAYVLAGHIHPCVSLGARAWDRLRLPCYWLGDSVGVLPAFGAFTGMHPIRPVGADRVFPVADGTVALLRPSEQRAA
ncbi:MAG TPA: ligase-associated DNA damage response endonuclease PdeM [Caldimonas sp.]|nr:ligase-associated DNA damage response endonuclease PdeM [Caldimonas sp.]HEX2540800.1 ligase-associated DNA damage response endonuclease PdeM [Caldimonas sp.]